MIKKRIIRPLQHYLGIEWSHVSRVEQSVSALGGFFGILFIMLISGPYLHEPAGALIVASMGASAVLLFAVPHGPLSQPWALMSIGGINPLFTEKPPSPPRNNPAISRPDVVNLI